MKWGIYLTTAKPPVFSEHHVISESIKMAQRAEALGFESAWLLEHHFTDYGLCGSTNVMAAYILGATRRLRVGTAINIVPIEHPVRLAEQVLLLDQMSEGRFILGIGRGLFDKDFDVFGADLATTREYTAEALQILRRAFAGEEFAYQSARYDWPRVHVKPGPFSPGGPQIVSACMSPATIRWAAENGLPMIMQHDVENEEKASNVELYRAIAAEAGRGKETPEHTLSLVTGVDEDGEGLRERSAQYLGWWTEEAQRAQRFLERIDKGGHGGYEWQVRKWREAVLSGDSDTAKRVRKMLRLNPIGTAQECIDKIKTLVTLTDCRRLVCCFEALADYELANASMERFATDVIPAIERWEKTFR